MNKVIFDITNADDLSLSNLTDGKINDVSLGLYQIINIELYNENLGWNNNSLTMEYIPLIDDDNDYSSSNLEMTTDASLQVFRLLVKTGNYRINIMNPSQTPITYWKIKNVDDQIVQEGDTTENSALSFFSAYYLKSKGYNPQQLKDLGFTVRQLKTVEFTALSMKYIYSLTELKEGGFRTIELKNIGFSLYDLKNIGTSIIDLKYTGFPLSTFVKFYTLEELKNAGFTLSQLFQYYTASELNEFYTLEQVKELGFTTQQLIDAGYTISYLKNDLNYTAEQVKELGFTTQQLIDGGYNKDYFVSINYTVEQVKELGFTTQELIDGGYNKDYFVSINYTVEQVKELGFTTQQLIDAGYTITEIPVADKIYYDITGNQDLSDASLSEVTGVPENLIINGTYVKVILYMNDSDGDGWNGSQFSLDYIPLITESNYDGNGSINQRFTLSNGRSGIKNILLKKGIYNINVTSGSWPSEISWSLRDIDDNVLRSGGAPFNQPFSLYSVYELKNDLNYTVEEVKAVGFTPQQLIDGGYTVSYLKSLNYTVEQVKALGFTLQQLLDGGYTITEIPVADKIYYDITGNESLSDTSLSEVTGVPENLITDGIYVKVIVNFSKRYNYPTINNKMYFDYIPTFEYLNYDNDGNNTKNKKLNVLYNGQPYTLLMKKGIYNVIVTNGIYSNYNQYVSWNIKDIYGNALRNGGAPFNQQFSLYSLDELKNDINYTVEQVKASGFTLQQLIDEGYTVSYLKNDLNYTAEQVKALGFTLQQLIDGGYTVSYLKSLNYTVEQVKALGFTLQQLIDGGYTYEDLLYVGYIYYDITGNQDLSDASLSEVTGVPENLIINGTYVKVILYMNDSFSDGWDGAQFSLDYIPLITESNYDGDGSINQRFTLISGRSGIKNILLKKGIYNINVTSGSYPIEVSWTLKDIDGNVLLNGGAPFNKRFSLYSIDELENDLNYTSEQVLALGFTPQQLIDGGYNKDYFVSINYTAEQVKALGFTPQQLIDAGYNAIYMRSLGYSILSLRVLGYSLTELYNSFSGIELKEYGFTVEHFYDIDFDLSTIKSFGYTIRQLNSKFTLLQLKEYFSLTEFLNEGYVISQLQYLYSIGDLLQFLQDGYIIQDIQDIIDVGFTTQKLIDDGYNKDYFVSINYTVEQVKALGFTPQQLIDAGYTYEDLLYGGYIYYDITGNESLSDTSLSEVTGVPENLITDGTYVKVIVNFSKRYNHSTINNQMYFDYIPTLENSNYDNDGNNSTNKKLNILYNGQPYTLLMKKGIYNVIVTNAKYSYDNRYVSWNIKDIDGNVLLNGGAPFNQPFSLYSLDELKNDLNYTAVQIKALGFTLQQLIDGGYTVSYLKNDPNYTVEQVKALGFTLQQLIDGGYTISYLINDVNYTVEQVKALGFTLQQLIDEGYTVSYLKNDLNYTAEQVKALGFTPQQLIDEGYTVSYLINDLNYTAEQVKALGFTPQQLIDGGYTISYLINDVNYTVEEVLALGFTLQQLIDEGYTVSYLKNDLNYTAEQVKALGFTLQQLIDGGYTVSYLKNDPNYTVEQVKALGFTLQQLIDGGYNKDYFVSINYTVEQVKAFGFTQQQLIDEGYTVSYLKNDLNYTVEQVKALGFTLQQLIDGGYTVSYLKSLNYTAEEVKALGFSIQQLIDGGYTVSYLKSLNYTVEQVKEFGFTPQQLIDGGYNKEYFVSINYTVEQVLALGFTQQQLIDGGYNKEYFVSINYTVEEVLALGFTQQQLIDGGYTITEIPVADKIYYDITGNQGLSDASLSEVTGVPENLIIDGTYVKVILYMNDSYGDGWNGSQFSLDYIPLITESNYDGNGSINQRFTLSSGRSGIKNILLKKGFYNIYVTRGSYPAEISWSLRDIDDNVLRSGGAPFNQSISLYSVYELKNDLNYTAEQVKALGFTLQQLIDEGYTVSYLKNDVNYTVEQVKALGFTLQQLIDEGYTVSYLKNDLNYTAEQVKALGFTQQQLIDGGYTVSYLKNDVNYTVEEVLALGFTQQQLIDGGYTVSYLKNDVNYTVEEVLALGFTQQQLIDGGYNKDYFASINYTVEQVKELGFTLQQLIDGGYTVSYLKSLNYTVEEVKALGFTPQELIDGGYINQELASIGYIGGCRNKLAKTYSEKAVFNDNSCVYEEVIDPRGLDLTSSEIKEALKESFDGIIGLIEDETLQEEKIDYLVNNNYIRVLLAATSLDDVISANISDEENTEKNKNKVRTKLKYRERLRRSTNKLTEYLNKKRETIQNTVFENDGERESVMEELKKILPNELINRKIDADNEMRIIIAETYGIQSTKLENKTVQVQIVTDGSKEIELVENELLAIEVPLNVTVTIKTQGGEVLNLKTEISTTTSDKVVKYNDVEYTVGDTILTNNGDLLIVKGIGSILLEPGKSLVQRDASYSEFLVITDLVTNEDVNVVNYNVLQDVSNAYLYDGESLLVEISGNTTNVISSVTVTTDGLLNVTLKPDTFGTDTITLKITSSLNVNDFIIKDLPLQVLVNDVPTITQIQNLTIKEGESLEIPVTITDVEGGYTVSVSQNPVVLERLSYADGKIRAIAKEEYANDVSTNVTVTVIDGDHTVTEEFIINITSINDPHTLLLLNGKASVNEGENIVIRYIVNDNDLLASSGTYTLELYKNDITEPIQIETINGVEGNKTISGNVTIGTATERSDRTETYRIKIIDSVGISVEASRSITISQVRGCTDSAAANYNSNATIDDESCFIVGYADGVLRLDVR
jgi:hypothetical protein